MNQGFKAHKEEREDERLMKSRVIDRLYKDFLTLSMPSNFKNSYSTVTQLNRLIFFNKKRSERLEKLVKLTKDLSKWNSIRSSTNTGDKLEETKEKVENELSNTEKLRYMKDKLVRQIDSLRFNISTKKKDLDIILKDSSEANTRSIKALFDQKNSELKKIQSEKIYKLDKRKRENRVLAMRKNAQILGSYVKYSIEQIASDMVNQHNKSIEVSRTVRQSLQDITINHNNSQISSAIINIKTNFERLEQLVFRIENKPGISIEDIIQCFLGLKRKNKSLEQKMITLTYSQNKLKKKLINYQHIVQRLKYTNHMNEFISKLNPEIRNYFPNELLNASMNNEQLKLTENDICNRLEHIIVGALNKTQITMNNIGITIQQENEYPLEKGINHSGIFNAIENIYLLKTLVNRKVIVDFYRSLGDKHSGTTDLSLLIQELYMYANQEFQMKIRNDLNRILEWTNQPNSEQQAIVDY